MDKKLLIRQKGPSYRVYMAKTIQRDTNDIRGFLETGSSSISKQIEYDQKEHGYRLKEVYEENLIARDTLAK